MQAHHFHKPENVLRRAQDLIAVGKKQIALELLHDLLCARRHRTWQKTHEEVMEVFLTLCVELKNNRMAKEGLHQYRNISQQQAPKSLEVVIDFMLKLAYDRAKKASEQCTSKIVSDVDDLENDTTPESVLLATVTSEKGKERTERKVLVPWLKFLWETYRTVLEILRGNPKLEHVYHRTAFKAFAFCAEYERNTEFRRLCDILRNHLSNQQKYSKEPDKQLSAETMEFHLATRFEQLKVASALRLWHEGFRTIEDIHQIMSISEKRPSSQLMATYYQKLTHLFLISENYLYHAFAHKAFFLLSREKNKSLTAEQTELMASSVLLAALSVPLQSSKAGTTFVEEGLEKEKNRRMAQLLGFDINPKRQVLLDELTAQHGILSAVSPTVRKLYDCLQDRFAPLTLIDETMPLLNEIRQHEKLKVYIKPLEQLLVVRLVTQLSSVYYSVKLDHFKSLVSGLETPFLEIEKSVAKAVKARQINVHSVRIDHQAGCIRFGEDVMEEDRTKSLLVDMAHGLSRVNQNIVPNNTANQAHARAGVVDAVRRVVAARHGEILLRKAEIERRKENLEKQQAQKIELVKRERVNAIQLKRQEEAKLAAEQMATLRAQQEAIALNKAKLEEERLQADRSGADSSKLAGLDSEQIKALVAETKKKAAKDTVLTQRKIQATARKLDALVRASRETEAPLRATAYTQLVEQQKTSHTEGVKARNAAAVEEHEYATKRKQELAVLQEFRASFDGPLIEAWKAEYEKECETQAKEREVRRFQDKLLRARRRRTEELEAETRREEEAERARLENEQRQQEAERMQAEREERERSNPTRRVVQDGPASRGSGGGGLSQLSSGNMRVSGGERPRFTRGGDDGGARGGGGAYQARGGAGGAYQGGRGGAEGGADGGAGEGPPRRRFINSSAQGDKSEGDAGKSWRR